MKNLDLLMLLAQELKSMPSDGYSLSNYDTDALAVAGQMPEFQRAGLLFASNDDGPRNEMHPRGSRRVTYKGLYDIDAAAAFFGISVIEAQHLFGMYEQNSRGYSEKSNFDPEGGPNRRLEPPAWTGGRIKVFIREKEQAENTAKASA